MFLEGTKNSRKIGKPEKTLEYFPRRLNHQKLQQLRNKGLFQLNYNSKAFVKLNLLVLIFLDSLFLCLIYTLLLVMFDSNNRIRNVMKMWKENYSRGK
jgi:hypothetical protein